jgi:phosphatidylglycerophosphate synthase
MQVVIALPGSLEISPCGVPLLVRVIATALRSGANKVLLLVPAGSPPPLLDHPAISSAMIETADISKPFDPTEPEHWNSITNRLDNQFLWMPCDYLLRESDLTELMTALPGCSETFDQPAVLLKCNPLAAGTADARAHAGLSLRSITVKEAEHQLVRWSGKVTDGIYSRFNRRLCWNAVRWLSHTAITPIVVTVAGLVIAIPAGFCFAQGTWFWNVTGAIFFFLSGLFDKMDGMLARLKFQDSPNGCWLETMADYVTYLFVFTGMTIGAHNRGGQAYSFLGLTLLAGSILAFIAVSMQRKLAAPANRPNEYCRRCLAALERDSANLISRTVRQVHFLLRKAVLVHYILLFAVLDLLPVFLWFAAFGAHATWIITFYLNRRLFVKDGSPLVVQRPKYPLRSSTT